MESRRIVQPTTIEISPLIPSLSLIMDSALNERELFHMRRIMNFHLQFKRQQSCDTIILQNITAVYGYPFTDKTLLYSFLAYGSRPLEKFESWPIAYQVDHYTYVSRFHEHFIDAIHRNIVSECHFFALFYAIQRAEKDQRSVYTQCIIDILRLLMNRNTGHPPLTSLQYIYDYSLSYLRRLSSDHWSFVDGAILSKLYNATVDMPCPLTIPDKRVIPGSLQNIQKDLETGNTLYGLLWLSLNEINGLLGAYKYLKSRDTVEGAAQMNKVLRSVRNTIAATFGILPSIWHFNRPEVLYPISGTMLNSFS
jgi:hypothetical protein